jgi:hypothetical protein
MTALRYGELRAPPVAPRPSRDERRRDLGLSVALRRCCGCHKTMGIGLWPWSGGWLVRTHGLCPRCFDALEPR